MCVGRRRCGVPLPRQHTQSFILLEVFAELGSIPSLPECHCCCVVQWFEQHSELASSLPECCAAFTLNSALVLNWNGSKNCSASFWLTLPKRTLLLLVSVRKCVDASVGGDLSPFPNNTVLFLQLGGKLRQSAKTIADFHAAGCVAGKSESVPPVYAVDTTDPEKWQTDVYEPTVRIIDAVLNVSTRSGTWLQRVLFSVTALRKIISASTMETSTLRQRKARAPPTVRHVTM